MPLRRVFTPAREPKTPCMHEEVYAPYSVTYPVSPSFTQTTSGGGFLQTATLLSCRASSHSDVPSVMVPTTLTGTSLTPSMTKSRCHRSAALVHLGPRRCTLTGQWKKFARRLFIMIILENRRGAFGSNICICNHHLSLFSRAKRQTRAWAASASASPCNNPTRHEPPYSRVLRANLSLANISTIP